MKMYMSILKIKIINCLQYRVSAFAGILTQYFWGIMLIMIYKAFYENTTQELLISIEQLVTYIWLQQSCISLVFLWVGDGEIMDKIVSGNLSYELCRPCDLYNMWYFKILGGRISNALLRFIPIIVISMVLPVGYRISMPNSLESFIYFLITLFFGLLINMAISMYIYLIAIITMNPTGATSLLVIVGEFFSGMLIPIPLMPEKLRVLTYLLPFRWIGDVSFRIYSGNIGVIEARYSLLIEVLWLIVLVISGKRIFNKLIKNTIIQGG